MPRMHQASIRNCIYVGCILEASWFVKLSRTLHIHLKFIYVLQHFKMHCQLTCHSCHKTRCLALFLDGKYYYPLYMTRQAWSKLRKQLMLKTTKQMSRISYSGSLHHHTKTSEVKDGSQPKFDVSVGYFRTDVVVA